MKRTFIVESDERLRLDVYLAAETDVTRSQIKNLVDKGLVTVGGARIKGGYILRGGDVVEVEFPEYVPDLVPKDIPLDILYEDGDIIVVNKQQGLTVHPAAGNSEDTLVNALLYRFGTLSGMGTDRPGIVHRLDKDTSGVLVVAKNDRAHAALAAQFAGRTVDKRYLAVLDGNVKQDEGIVTTRIARDPADRKRMAVTDGEGRTAITGYKTLERFTRHCYVQFTLFTGRTHQIRVHAKYLGCPVTGDTVYGAKKQEFRLNGQLLHAYRITLKHPTSGEEMTFTAPLPDSFEKVLRILRAKEARPCG